MHEPVLKATCLRKLLQRPARLEILKGISLQVHAGESLAIVGASGEGKTTLLHILGTLDQQTSGTLEIMGTHVDSRCAPSVRNKHVGFIFQSFNLLEDLTVLENVLMPAKIGRLSITKESLSFRRACELLDRMGLLKLAHYPTKLLSGGEKQRVAIARAFCNHPDLILADEPSGNLDFETSQKIHQLLIESVKKEGKALIVVTHDTTLAKMCDHVLRLEGGLLSKEKETNV